LPADRTADEETIARVLAGDTEAFGVLVDRHGRRVHAAILRMTGEPETASDLAQETLLKAFTGLGSFRRGSAFYTWLYAIALNQVRSEFRRRKTARGRRALSLDGGGDPDGQGGGPPEPVAGDSGPGENAVRNEEAERLHLELARLDEEFREAVVLRDLEGLSYEEISGILEVPVGTVRSRLHRGRAALRERLLPLGRAPAGRAEES